MCGRIQVQSKKEIFRTYGLQAVGKRTSLEGSPKPHTIIPGNMVPAIVIHKNHLTLTEMHWGFQIGDKLVYNARVETVEEKKTWAGSYHRSRMVFPVDSFFEHRWFTPKQPMAALGIYRRGNYDTQTEHFIWEASMLTKPADDTVSEFHPRMPILVPKSQITSWLDKTMEVDDVLPNKDYLDVTR